MNYRPDTRSAEMKSLGWLLCVSSLWLASAAVRGVESPLELEATIPLPAIKGRIDHLAIDLGRKRLFVAALGNDTLEVVDLSRNRHERSLTGFGEPQGVLYVAGQDRVYVANGKADRVDILDGTTLEVKKRLVAEDADNLRLDASGKRAIVGYGKGALRMIEIASEQAAGEIKLPGHPESFQLEQRGARIFVNVPDAHQVSVVDREKRAIVATWDTGNARANFPMALDESSGRLFVGARKPAVVLVYDTASGKVVANLTIGQDTDDIFYDTVRKRLYVICGEGRVDVFSQQSPDRYISAGSIQTAARARTGLFVPESGRLYVAAPAMDRAQARVLVYRVR
jgi:DNA-binding beta-propeller fold protein YncE